MSKYTVELRWCVEQALTDRKLANVEDNWEQVYETLGLSDYPIYDESHRKTLNDKIIRAYWMRELGFETFAQFRWQLRRMMHEIMPYYNQLYESVPLVTDPIISKNLDWTEKWTRDEVTANKGKSDSNTDSKSHAEGTAHDRNVYQDTPMNGLDTGAIEDMDYATNVTFDDSTTTNDANSNTKVAATNANDYTGDFEGTRVHNQKGYDGNPSELLLTYRKTLLNIDLEIVDRLGVLFMRVW